MHPKRPRVSKLSFGTTLILALSLCLSLPGCATRSVKPTLESRPAAAMQYCPELPVLPLVKGDDGSTYLGVMVDYYRDCAIRHNTLVNWENEHGH